MTTRDLLEQASLDALGLLDEQERKDFERAFAAAPSEVKAQLRREQSRFADLDRWLPAVEPPADLKGRVMAAVRNAIESVSTPEVAGRIAVAPTHWWHAAPLWRAAAIGFATASVVLAGFFFSVSQANKRIVELTDSNQLTDLNLRQGGKLDDVLLSVAKNNRQTVVFDMAPGVAASMELVLDFNNESGDALLVTRGLPVADGEYSLVVLGDDGKPLQILKQFEAAGGATMAQLSLKSRDGVEAMKSLGKLALVGPMTRGGQDQILMIARPA